MRHAGEANLTGMLYQLGLNGLATAAAKTTVARSLAEGLTNRLGESLASRFAE